MYQALYSKWRPQTFDDVYGQQQVTRTLKNEISTQRISHAYLFTGSRGTGKTTCARILSKAVNCLHPVNGNPCNECEICRDIDNDKAYDITEIDAASNNGVDNIRDLREEANFTPAKAKYRVYIIDEVHMLSPGAFNALLKTLEEPPAHVIFILATTEIHKLPATILSRCQRFDFKRISADEIVRRIKYIADGENVTINDEAANLIANISDGGMRDAVSMLDRCLSVTSEIDENTVSDVAGIAGTSHMFKFSDCISRRDFTGALNLVSELHSSYCDVDRICSRLSDHFRNLMVAYTVTNCEGLIICSKSELELYKAEAKKFRLSKILECIDIISQTSKIIKNATDKKIQFEAAVIKMCGAGNAAAAVSEDFDARLTALEQKISSIVYGNIPAAQTAPVITEESSPAEEKAEIIPEVKPEEKTEDKSSSEKTEYPAFKASDYIPAPAPSEPPKQEKVINPPVIDTAPAAPPVTPPKDTSIEPAVPSVVSIPDGPFTDWPEVLENLQVTDAILYGLISDTTATVNLGKLVIDTTNKTLYDYISSETGREHYRNLLRAVYNITGQKMKVVIHQVSQQSVLKQETGSPLENMVSKINKFNEQGE